MAQDSIRWQKAYDAYKKKAKPFVPVGKVKETPSKRKLYYKYPSQEDRITGWKNNRKGYSEWRISEDGIEWVNQRRKKQFNKCFICLTDLGRYVHVDHIFPLYLGGTNNPVNLCVVHPDCNMKKGVKVYMTYKQACKRREMFNKIHLGLNVLFTLERKPDYKPKKEQIKNIRYVNKWLTNDEIITEINRRKLSWSKKPSRLLDNL